MAEPVPAYTTKDFHPSLPAAPRQAREVSKDEKKNRKDFQKFMTQIEGFKTDVSVKLYFFKKRISHFENSLELKLFFRAY